jgi:hypothetical protein
MMAVHPGSRSTAFVLAGVLTVLTFKSIPGCGAEYGRLSGTVADSQGDPLMGATVLLSGPMLASSSSLGSTIERVITDAHGRFTIEHLAPGWYSLRVTSPTRLPVLRSGIQVEPGHTATQNFVLTDVFAPFRFQVPKDAVSSWGDDWKWVLRTSPATRPILRYEEQVAQATVKALPAPSRRLIGMVPGSARQDPLAGDPGMGSVLAYLQPISDDSDLLVAGLMTASGTLASSVATSFRTNLIKGDPQELTLVIHQLSFSSGGVPPAATIPGSAFERALGAVVNYSQTRVLSTSLRLTAGMQVQYLNAQRDAMTAQPRLKLEYRGGPATTFAIQYGTNQAEGSATLLERVGMLNAFPRVTLRDYRPKLEQLNHAELSLNRHVKKASRLKIAAYHDATYNAAVWGGGRAGSFERLAGNFLPNPVADGITVNVGDYSSSGLRAAYLQDIGNNVHALFAYALGNALTSSGIVGRPTGGDLQGVLRPASSATLAGKVSAVLPVTHTQLVTSYEYVQRGRLTIVDPSGQADLQLQPFLGVQIRQPLPTIAFLPARIEAIADFRNLLDQGNVRMGQAGEQPVLLTPLYRSFRGGFSVQF